VNVTEILDQIMRRSDRIGSPTADYADRRQLHLDFLREIVDDVWYFRDWPWKRTTENIVVPDGIGFVAMPANYSSMGKYGSIYRLIDSSNTGNPLEERPEGDIFDLRQTEFITDDPRIFCFSGQDTDVASPTLGRPYFQIPWNKGDLTFAVWYQMLTPTLDESANVENLKLIPEKYHQSVIVHGMRYKAIESKGDDRWAFEFQEYEKGKKMMKEEEARLQGRTPRLPSFFGRRW
jgi:hypothetical protein